MDSDGYPPSPFDNTEIAFKRLNDSALKKSLRLFQMMNRPWLVNIGNSLMLKMIQLNIPILGMVKKTIFAQFCGGEKLDDTIPIVQSLAKYDVDVLLNYSVEGLENAQSYKNTYERTLDSILFAKENPTIKAICIKFTGFASMDIWVKLQNQIELMPNEQEEYQQAKFYIDTLCHEAQKSDVQLYIDAEESWFQDSIDYLAMKMMRRYNQTEAVVFNTYQLYRNDKLAQLEQDFQTAENEGFVLGAKIVRGAYVEKENEHAQKNNQPSPIHKSKPETDADFDHAMKFCIEHLDKISVCVASHNEESNELLLKTLQEKKIPLNHKNLCSSQLYGMSDNITFNMAALGVKATKYLPYGPVKEVIPYLIRRAQENTSIGGQTSREYELLHKELKRRDL